MFGSIFNLNMLSTILVAIVDGSHHQKSQKWLSTKAPPFNIEACNKNQTPLRLAAMFKLKNDSNKFHVEL